MVDDYSEDVVAIKNPETHSSTACTTMFLPLPSPAMNPLLPCAKTVTNQRGYPVTRSATTGSMTPTIPRARIMVGSEKVLLKEMPDMTLVQGDARAYAAGAVMQGSLSGGSENRYTSYVGHLATCLVFGILSAENAFERVKK